MQGSRKILLDTNFLLIPEVLHIDIFEELKRICHFPYTLFILDKTVAELQVIVGRSKGKDKRAAGVAIELIKLNNIQIIDTTMYPPEDYVDSILKQLADEYIIATQDRDIQKKCKQYIIVRQLHYLQLKNDTDY